MGATLDKHYAHSHSPILRREAKQRGVGQYGRRAELVLLLIFSLNGNLHIGAERWISYCKMRKNTRISSLRPSVYPKSFRA